MLQIFMSYGQTAAAVVALVTVAQSAYISFKAKNYKVMALMLVVLLLFMAFLYNTLWSPKSCGCTEKQDTAVLTTKPAYSADVQVAQSTSLNTGKDGKMATGML